MDAQVKFGKCYNAHFKTMNTWTNLQNSIQTKLKAGLLRQEMEKWFIFLSAKVTVLLIYCETRPD